MKINDRGPLAVDNTEEPNLADSSDAELTSLFDEMVRNRNPVDIISFLEGRTQPETNAEVRILRVHQLLVSRGIPQFAIAVVTPAYEE